jgi:hypothetical protein
LICIEEKDGIKNAGLAITPLEFGLPEEIMADPNPFESVKYKILGGFIPPGTDNDGHCIMDIKNADGLWEFNDDVEQRLDNETGKNGIKIKLTPGTWLADKRENPDDVSSYRNAMRFLNAIPAFRDGIMKNDSGNPLDRGNSLVLVLREIFGGIDSKEGIQREHLEKLLGENLFPEFNIDIKRSCGKLFNLDGKGDMSNFSKCGFDKLESGKNQLVQCFQFKKRTIYPDDECNNKDQLLDRLYLPIKWDPEEGKDPEEFTKALETFGKKKKKDGNQICYDRIENPPEVLLIRIYEKSKDETKMRVR